MELITGFDIPVLLAMLVAVWFAKMPIQAGIAACALFKVMTIEANGLLDQYPAFGDPYMLHYYVIFCIEASAAIIFLAASKIIYKERVFFRVMAAFFITFMLCHLVIITAEVLFDLGATWFPAYLATWHAIELAQVLFVLWSSDGIRNGIDHVWRYFADMLNHSGLRHRKG